MLNCQKHKTKDRHTGGSDSIVIWNNHSDECPACEMQARIDELEEQMRWKSYPEEKPKKQDYYYVFIEDVMNFAASAFYNGDEFIGFDFANVNWMEIPKFEVNDERTEN